MERLNDMVTRRRCASCTMQPSERGLVVVGSCTSNTTVAQGRMVCGRTSVAEGDMANVGGSGVGRGGASSEGIFCSTKAVMPVAHGASKSMSTEPAGESGSVTRCTIGPCRCVIPATLPGEGKVL